MNWNDYFSAHQAVNAGRSRAPKGTIHIIEQGAPNACYIVCRTGTGDSWQFPDETLWYGFSLSEAEEFVRTFRARNENGGTGGRDDRA